MRIFLLLITSLFFIGGCQSFSSLPFTNQNNSEPDIPSHPLQGQRYTTPELFLILDNGSGEHSLQPISVRARTQSHRQPDIQVKGVIAKGTALQILGASADGEQHRVWLGYQQQRFMFTMASVTETDIQWFVTSDDCQRLRQCRIWQNEIQRCMSAQTCKTSLQFHLTDKQGQRQRNLRPPFPTALLSNTLNPIRQYSQQQGLLFEPDPVLAEGVLNADATALAHLFFHQTAFNIRRDGIYAAD